LSVIADSERLSNDEKSKLTELPLRIVNQFGLVLTRAWPAHPAPRGIGRDRGESLGTRGRAVRILCQIAGDDIARNARRRIRLRFAAS
jgi:hypothetical protein